MKKKQGIEEKIMEVFSRVDVRTLYTEEEYKDVQKETEKLEKEIDELTERIEKDNARLRKILMEFLENRIMLTNYEELKAYGK